MGQNGNAVTVAAGMARTEDDVVTEGFEFVATAEPTSPVPKTEMFMRAGLRRVGYPTRDGTRSCLDSKEWFGPVALCRCGSYLRRC